MYCFRCGAPDVGAFCPACGQNQSAASRGAPERPAEPVVEATLAWSDSLNYELVIADAEVRQHLSAVQPSGLRGVSGDDLLKVFDAVSPIGFSLGKLSSAVLPIYDKLGIKTQHQSEAKFHTPAGRLMLAALSSLAHKSLTIDAVEQGTNQCLLISKIPSGLITNRGQLSILLERQGPAVRVVMSTTLSAQLYDWGKSKRLQQELFELIGKYQKNYDATQQSLHKNAKAGH